MAGRLMGKVAVVTASTEGIGYAVAKRLCNDGAKVMISSRKESNVEKAVQDLKSMNFDVDGVVCHVGKQEDRDALINTTLNRFGAINILVCNAGINPTFGPMLDTTEEAWDKIFSINLKSTFFLTKEIYPYIKKSGGGSIVYTSSISAYNPFELLGPYSVSKTALLGLTRALTPELARDNISINCVCPGFISTKFSDKLLDFEDHIKSLIPMKRFGKPEECANLVSFLVSDEASYITGETYVIAGGQSSRL